ncbi:MAG: MFS transporter [Candidatus Neomarinimicrobiota bacterium]
MQRDTKIILAVTCGSHLTVHTLMLVLPSILLVLQGEFGVGLDTLGYIVAASSFMFGLGALPAGFLEKRLGGRRLLLIYQTGTAAAVALIVISRSLTMLTVGMMVLGFFASLYHPAGLTLISRRVKNLSRALAYHGVAGTSGLALGPLIAASVTDLFSWRAAFAIMALFNLALAFVTTRMIPPRTAGSALEDDAQNTSVTNRPALIIFYLISVFMGLAFAGFTTFMPTHFSLNAAEITEFLSVTIRGGLFTTIVFLGGVVGQIIGGHLGDRYYRPALLAVLLSLNIPLLMIVGFTTETLLIVTAIGFGIVHFAMQPVTNALIANLTHSRARGIGYGINFFLSFGVGSVGAAVGGYIAERFGVAYVFPVMALVIVPTLLLVWRLLRLLPRTASGTAA